MTYDRRIVAVRIGRMTIQRSNSSTVYVRIDEAPFGTIIIPVSEVVQSRFLIEDIPTIAERIVNAERRCQRTSDGDLLAPCIVLVFYYKVAAVVKDSYNISLEIVEVGVGRAVEVYLRGAGLRIIEEVQLVIADDHVRNQLAVESVVRYFRLSIRSHLLLYAQAGRIILEFNRLGRLDMVNPCICTD